MKFWYWILAGIWVTAGSAQAEDNSRFYCPDYYSHTVAWVESSSQLTSAQAGYTVSGQPLIRVNSSALNAMKLTPDTRKFALFHECAHHVLGHVVQPPKSAWEAHIQASEADCWAANRFYYYESNGKSKVAEIEKEINALTRTNWVRFPGPVRVVDLTQSCEFRKQR